MKHFSEEVVQDLTEALESYGYEFLNPNDLLRSGIDARLLIYVPAHVALCRFRFHDDRRSDYDDTIEALQIPLPNMLLVMPFIYGSGFHTCIKISHVCTRKSKEGLQSHKAPYFNGLGWHLSNLYYNAPCYNDWHSSWIEISKQDLTGAVLLNIKSFFGGVYNGDYYGCTTQSPLFQEVVRQLGFVVEDFNVPRLKGTDRCLTYEEYVRALAKDPDALGRALEKMTDDIN